MDISLFDYDLPKELIAQKPIEPRDHSRLLVLREAAGKQAQSQQAEIAHDVFYHLPQYLKSGDLLVFNRTRVLPARLVGRKADTGGQAECFLLHQVAPGLWSCLVKPGRRLTPGVKLVFGDGELEGVIEERTDEGGRLVRFLWQGDFEDAINQVGQVPLPPYIHENLEDPERYQTVYGDIPGSAAAPTAGLHFTDRILNDLRMQGVESAQVLLHVGVGTFRPVSDRRIEDHKMHGEYCEVSDEAARAVNRAKAEGRRVIAVGTTALRTLEGMGASGTLESGSGWTDLFIYPGYTFRIIDGLLTNFHLPKSSLLMLVSALAGRERVLGVYQEAIREKYRFFSFGDAMLIL
ncbi:MAG: tRNA preQ1(34) S-adenosylmethionine ribosyltransferase-isomerase QueA [Peptococcaceae bacterium]|jgi:S-adenosylmethionine:tRNA ribosyltransferase-isomerase|nr:tRNA preQ1(34) S-adenosylmethionine ribosyltransferase-isomerase QueA [Peptococcaceae bacterium]